MPFDPQSDGGYLTIRDIEYQLVQWETAIGYWLGKEEYCEKYPQKCNEVGEVHYQILWTGNYEIEKINSVFYLSLEASDLSQYFDRSG